MGSTQQQQHRQRTKTVLMYFTSESSVCVLLRGLDKNMLSTESQQQVLLMRSSNGKKKSFIILHSPQLLTTVSPINALYMFYFVGKKRTHARLYMYYVPLFMILTQVTVSIYRFFLHTLKSKLKRKSFTAWLAHDV